MLPTDEVTAYSEGERVVVGNGKRANLAAVLAQVPGPEGRGVVFSGAPRRKTRYAVPAGGSTATVRSGAGPTGG